MSLVHAKKTLARVRDRDLLSWTKRQFHIKDEERLARLAKREPPAEALRPVL